ncbi:MAG: xanthine dehydrogenase family protein subunit M [Deltaproteobacteria bacterium]|nr:xanthine dehydrogenase family protein subunit M [Deltaproteobacteria bacterium]
MRPVDLPGTLEELWRLLADRPRSSLYAGGTDLLPEIRSGKTDPPALICLERIPELRGVTETPAAVRLGACTTHAHLLANPVIRKEFPVLVQALKTLGSPLIRQMGTIGGNICTASPAGDTLPPLYVLKAEVELRTHDDRRTLPIAEFITGPRRTQLRPGEIVAAVFLNKSPCHNLHHFEKVGLRKSLACSVASLAAVLNLSEAGIVEAAQLAWGSLGPTVVTSVAAEAELIGRPLSIAALERAADAVRKAISPIDDIRADAAYRRAVAGNLLLRLAHACGQSQGRADHTTK